MFSCHKILLIETDFNGIILVLLEDSRNKPILHLETPDLKLSEMCEIVKFLFNEFLLRLLVSQ